jgi:hypothetical protein
MIDFRLVLLAYALVALMAVGAVVINQALGAAFNNV